MGQDPSDQRADVDAWIRQHQARAWRYVRLRGCPADLADDLVQEALMAALQKGIGREPPERAQAWLCSALDKLWLMHLRSEGRRIRRHERVLAARALEQCALQDDGNAWLQALRGCLVQLDGRARRLLDLHYGEGASRESIAGTFGIRVSGVKTFLRRIRGILRECVLRTLRREQEAIP
jgi:RNA polymerase sigma-70 factor (ECF subfamily)